jgi:hypothetical protein
MQRDQEMPKNTLGHDALSFESVYLRIPGFEFEKGSEPSPKCHGGRRSCEHKSRYGLKIEG